MHSERSHAKAEVCEAVRKQYDPIRTRHDIASEHGEVDHKDMTQSQSSTNFPWSDEELCQKQLEQIEDPLLKSKSQYAHMGTLAKARHEATHRL